MIIRFYKENFYKRNLLLSLYLYLNLLATFYFLKTEFDVFHSDSGFENYFFIGAGIVEVVSILLILNWKKIGFFSLLLTSFSVAVFNLLDGYGMVSLLSLISILILSLLLLLKKDGLSGWENLFDF